MGTVSAASPRYGTALHQTTGGDDRPGRTSCSTRSACRCRTSPPRASTWRALRKLELKFGGAGMPATGSIQLSDVRFQEAAAGTKVYTDKLADVRRPPPARRWSSRGTRRHRRTALSRRRRRPRPRDRATACETASAAIASTRRGQAPPHGRPARRSRVRRRRVKVTVARKVGSRPQRARVTGEADLGQVVRRHGARQGPLPRCTRQRPSHTHAAAKRRRRDARKARRRRESAPRRHGRIGAVDASRGAAPSRPSRAATPATGAGPRSSRRA